MHGLGDAGVVAGVLCAAFVGFAMSVSRYPKFLLRGRVFAAVMVVAGLGGMFFYGFPAVALSWCAAVGFLLLGVLVLTRLSLKTLEAVTLIFLLTPWLLWWIPAVAFSVVGVVSLWKVWRAGGLWYVHMIVGETVGAFIYGVVPHRLFRKGPLVVKPDLSRLPFPQEGNENVSEDAVAGVVEDADSGDSVGRSSERVRTAQRVRMNVPFWYGVGMLAGGAVSVLLAG